MTDYDRDTVPPVWGSNGEQPENPQHGPEEVEQILRSSNS